MIETVALGEVVDFVRGITFKPKDVVEPGTPGSVVCLRTKNVQTEVDLDDLLAVPTEFVRREDQFLQPGDVLISSSNSWNLVGKCSWIPRLPWRSSFGGFVTVLRPSSDTVDRRYLYYWFSYGRTQQLLRSFGRKTTNISNLSLDRCRSMEFPLPPVEEQRRIAAVLDAADALRVKRREALAKLDTLAQSIFIDMFGDPALGSRWPVRLLGDVCRSKGEYGANVPSEAASSSKPRYLRITDIRSDGSLNDEAVGPGGAERDWESKVLNEGDIVFARSGATVGKTFLMRAESEAMVFAGYLIRFVPDPAVVLPEYVFQYTRTQAYSRWVATAATTVAQPNVNATIYASMPMPIPPLSMQHRFGRLVTEARSQRYVMSGSAAEIDILFASSQQRAFRGEL